MQQYQKRYGNMIIHIWLIVCILTICGGMANSLRINSDDNRMDRTFDSGNQLGKLIINQRLKRDGSNGNGPCGKGNKGDVGCPCTTNTDCSTNICHQGKCKPSTCFDNIRNSHETDVDCGGGTCSACADGKVCKVGTDCNSGDCQSGKCKPLPTCDTCVINDFGAYPSGYSCAQVCARIPAIIGDGGGGGDGGRTFLFHNTTRGSGGLTLNNFYYAFYSLALPGSFGYDLYSGIIAIAAGIGDGGNADLGGFSSLDGSILYRYTYRDYTFNLYATPVTFTGSCARISATVNCGSDGIFIFPCGGGVGNCCCGFRNL